MLPFRLIEPPRSPHLYPLFPYSVGQHHQFHHFRPEGFPVHQLFLVQSGSGLFRDLEDGKEWMLGPGQAILLPPDRGHEYYPLSPDPWMVGFVGYSGELAGVWCGTGGRPEEKTLSPSEFVEAWEDIGRIWHVFPFPGPARQNKAACLEISALLYRLLLRFHSWDPAAGESESSPPRTEPSGALLNAVSLMNKHFREPLLISNLAQAVGYSVQHFQRLFQKEYGMTPHNYLQNLRLERALQLILEDDTTPVQEIAGRLGMETNYFIRLFRSKYGCTPGAMKKGLGNRAPLE